MSNERQQFVAPSAVDLSNCDREPIHVPGSIQPHGFLLVLDDDGSVVRQASENVTELTGMAAAQAVGRPLTDVLGVAAVAKLAAHFAGVTGRQRPILLERIAIVVRGAEIDFDASAHRTDGGLVVELERVASSEIATASLAFVDAFSLRVEEAQDIAELSRVTAEEIRRLTGYDRVLVYAFDADANGTVVGEDGNGRLPSLLDHRFPASDIPAQARELYRINRLRLIPDSSYRPVPLIPTVNPATGRPLDMSFCSLRSVSPIHVEYMRNMETASSMSVSLLAAGKLWGLVSCHHREPKSVPFGIRTICDLFARTFSLRLAALELTRDNERRGFVRVAYSKLLTAMAHGSDPAVVLSEHARELLSFADAGGAAILFDDRCYLVGRTPPEAMVREIAEWMFRELQTEVYETDALSTVFPRAAECRDAAGMLAIAISKLHDSGVFWFRPEVIQTVKWGGDPRKPVVADAADSRIRPRHSFETWKETVRGKSIPWRSSEIEGAHDLRNAIIGIVLRKAEELADLNAELLRSNKELESFSYSVSHDLRAPLRHIVGYAEMLKQTMGDGLPPKGERCVNTIIESSEYAGLLVDKLLAYSRMGRAELQLSNIDMGGLFREVADEVGGANRDRRIRVQIAELPTIRGDLMMLRDAVRNLLENAVKYSKLREETVIEVASYFEGAESVFSVKDNGIGFDQKYAGKLFGVFQRLHRVEEYEGTGIGLANVRRVMERHGGRVWAEGEEGKGATFYFTIFLKTEFEPFEYRPC